MEREFEHAEGVEVSHLAVGSQMTGMVMARAAGPNDELPNAVRVVLLAILVDRGEALVIVVVSDDDDVGVCVAEQIPDRGHTDVVPMLARTVAGMMPVGEDMRSAMRGKILLQPGILWRFRITRDIRIDHDDVPGGEII